MKYNIETFLIDEPEVNELEEECKNNIELLEKAGLETLVEALKEKDGEEVPFRMLSEKEYNLTKYYYYDYCSPNSFKTPLPLQVASLLALCNEKCYFNEIQIRNDNNSSHPFFGNFVAIGYDKHNHYIIARWSLHELIPLGKLEELATPIIKKRLEEKIKIDILEKQQDLEKIDDLVNKYINGQYCKYYL